MKVGLYVRITVDGKQKYCGPVYAANKKLRAGHAMIGGKVEACPNAVFALRYRENGKRKWQEVGRDPAQALAAKLRREHILQGRALGLLPDQDLAMAVAEPTKRGIEAEIGEYLAHLLVRSKPRSVDAYRRALDVFRAAVSPTIYIEDLRNDDIRAYLANLKSSGIAPRTAANRLGYVQSFLLSRGTEGIIKDEDWPKYTKRAPNSYNREFLQRLFAACGDEDRQLFKFFLSTGCREQEVMYACWSDLDLVRGTLTIREKEQFNWTLKDYEERIIPLSLAYAAELKARREQRPGDQLIFPTKAGKPEGHFLRRLKKVALGAGLNCGHCVNKKAESCQAHPVCKDIELHRFRRTFATMAHHEGKNSVNTIQRWLGHSDIETTMLYLASADDDAPGVRERLELAFSL